MGFKVRAYGRDDKSGFDLFYGKAGNKLSVAVERAGTKFTATIGGETMTGQLKQLKEAFGAWAVANYGGTKSDGIQSDAPPLTNTAEPEQAGPAPKASDDDELTNRERAFFETLSKKKGTLTEFQRSQCKNLLRSLCGIKESPNGGSTLLGRAGTPSGPPIVADVPVVAQLANAYMARRIGPPSYKPKVEETNEHAEEHIGTDSPATDGPAGTEQEENSGE